jgi:uncharacterized membrane protein
MDFLQDIFSLFGSVPVIRVILASLLVFFLPGFAWSLVFFSKKINVLERAALSLGMSIALVTLAVLVLNVLLHVRINGFNALITILVLTAIAFAVFFIKRFAAGKSGASSGE